MRAFSNGGGVQSTAALVLSAQRRIDFPIHVFANVGDDSENPATIAYVRDHVKPYALAHGIEFREVKRNGATLYQHITKPSRSIDIPMRFDGGRPGRRKCTAEFKIKVVRRALGAGDHIVGLGISMDEFQRMRTDSGFPNVTNEYPLIDLRLSRADCMKIVADAGLPVPPKSSCWFCPFKRPSQWAEMRRNDPGMFQMAAELETQLSARSVGMGRDALYLTRYGKPLSDAISQQPALFEDDNCDSGYCHT